MFNIIRKKITYKRQKVYDVSIPENIDIEIIEALRSLKVSEEEIEVAIRSSSFIDKKITNKFVLRFCSKFE